MNQSTPSCIHAINSYNMHFSLYETDNGIHVYVQRIGIAQSVNWLKIGCWVSCHCHLQTEYGTYLAC